MIAAAHTPAAQLQLCPERLATSPCPQLHNSCRGMGRSPAVRASIPGGLDPGGRVGQVRIAEAELRTDEAKAATYCGAGRQLPELTQRNAWGCSLFTSIRARRRAPSAPPRAAGGAGLPVRCTPSAEELHAFCRGAAYQLSATQRQRPGGSPKSFRGTPGPLGLRRVYFTERAIERRRRASPRRGAYCPTVAECHSATIPEGPSAERLSPLAWCPPASPFPPGAGPAPGRLVDFARRGATGEGSPRRCAKCEAPRPQSSRPVLQSLPASLPPGSPRA
jgi:hypothetical protein